MNVMALIYLMQFSFFCDTVRHNLAEFASNRKDAPAD